MRVRICLAFVVAAGVVSSLGCCDKVVFGSALPSALAGTGGTKTGAGGVIPAVGASGGAAGVGAGSGAGGATAAFPVSDTDYSKTDNWLCRPDHNEACSANLDATIVKADGST